jgi:rhamnosyltransferase
MPPNIVAGIVAYHPDIAALIGVIGAIAEGVSMVAVYANSPLPSGFTSQAQAQMGATKLVVVAAGENRGLGVAYNAIADIARRAGAGFVALFDQDSLPDAAMIGQLGVSFAALAAAGHRPAAIGPHPIEGDGVPFKLPLLGPPLALIGNPAPIKFIISSGTLLSLAALGDVGGFREDFFIDVIDIEWCLRARSKGLSIWVATAVGMPHSLGRGILKLPFGLRLADQPPNRLYTYVRNQFALLRLSYVGLRHKAFILGGIVPKLSLYILYFRFSADVARAIWWGVRDGALNRLGSPLAVWAALAARSRRERRP